MFSLSKVEIVVFVVVCTLLYLGYRRLTRPRVRQIKCCQCGRPTGIIDESDLGDSGGYCPKCVAKITNGRVRESADSARIIRAAKERADNVRH